jgi:hypothetical protein
MPFSFNLRQSRASTCFEHYLLILRRRYTNGIWYTAYVLCQLALARLQHYNRATVNWHYTHAIRIPTAVCAAIPEDEQVMLEACRGSWFSINRMKTASRWFHCTDILWCTVSHYTDILWCTVSHYTDILWCTVSHCTDILWCTVSQYTDILWCTVSHYTDILWCTVSHYTEYYDALSVTILIYYDALSVTILINYDALSVTILIYYDALAVTILIYYEARSAKY